MNKALKIAFRSGAVMGLCVSGLGLFGLGVVLCALDLGNGCGMRNRLWTRRIFHGAVWQSRRRYLHEGSRRWR